MLTQFFQRYMTELDASMRYTVNSRPKFSSDFGVMLRYALGWVDEHDTPYNLPTGKRIRPILLLLSTEAAGGDWRKSLPSAVAVELLHNFSLIHDDIQDNSLTRHNRPTVWQVWGTANAINAGDALFTLAYCALEELASRDIEPQTIIKIWRIFNDTMLELTRGQHLDMSFEHQAIVTTDEYLSMIEGKSAALLAACAQIGALIASDDDELSAAYMEFGLNIGLAFQIHDDILGIWGDPDVTGKSAATDILSRKKSLPVLYGLNKSEKLMSIYQRQTFTANDVTEAVKTLDAVGARKYAQETETTFYNRALAALESANPLSESGRWLKQLVEALFERQH